MAAVSFHGLSKRYGDVCVLDDFSFEAADGELIVVLGPSGCGKSTLLRLTAGLDTATSGSIHLDGQRIDALPPKARNVAMVFQSYALYPHMTVRENIEFPLVVGGVPPPERSRLVTETATMLEIGAFLDRRPQALSGGQRQRVALARALVRHPALFLLDEPMSNLDARLRASVRRELRALQRRLRVTTLLVTHDQQDAMTLGDRVVVLAAGRVQQVGTPAQVYDRPASTFVAAFVGSPPMNLLDATVAPGATLDVGGRSCASPPALRTRLPPEGARVIVGVRPEAFVPDAAGAPRALVAEPDPTTLERLGAECLVTAAVGTASVVVRMPATGDRVPPRVYAPLEAIHVFDAASGVRLDP